MDRRKAVAAITGAGVLLALRVAAAQQGKVWRIGVLSIRARPVSLDADFQYGAFLRGLRELGYVEGKNLLVEWRFAHGNYELLPGLAAELVNLRVDLIAAINAPVIKAAQRATTTIPIVMLTSSDPVGAGFVASLAHPGGNITGMTNVNLDLSAKYLELLHAIVPGLTSVAFLANPSNAAHRDFLQKLEAAAAKTHVQVVVMQANTPAAIDEAFASVAKKRPGGLIVGLDARLGELSAQISDLALRYRMPLIWWSSRQVRSGGVMSFGTDLDENYRLAAGYIDKIFKGARPGDLPVETPTTFELVINSKTAKALGLVIPRELLLRADQVLE